MRSHALLIALLLALAACGPLPHPFQPESKNDNNPLLMMRDRAGVAIRPVAGLPGPASQALTTALTEAFHRQGVVAMAGAGNSESMILSGVAQTDNDGWRVTLALVDHQGAPMGSLIAYMAPQDADSPVAWRDYANALARSVTALFTPPEPADAVPPSVLIADVTGEPADGGQTLGRALEYALRRAQVKMAEEPSEATHIVTATVTIAAPRGSAGRQVQNVDVRWIVKRADQSEVGEVRQTNDVPSQMLQRWPEIALAVADAAVDEIADLLKRAPSTDR